jgi:tellurite resistance protein
VNPLRRRLSKTTAPHPEHDYYVAVLRLQLLVAMAAVDDSVRLGEVEFLHEAIDGRGVDREHQQRLDQLLRLMLEAPPSIEDVVKRIGGRRPSRVVAETLVRELVHLAHDDGEVHVLEEEMLRLVCGALGVKPISMRRKYAREVPLTPREQERLDEILRTATTATAT